MFPTIIWSDSIIDHNFCDKENRDDKLSDPIFFLELKMQAILKPNNFFPIVQAFQVPDAINGEQTKLPAE